MAAVVDHFTHPNATSMINVDICRAEHHRFGSKQFSLQRLMHIKVAQRFLRLAPAGRLTAPRSHLGELGPLGKHVKLYARYIATGPLIGTAIIKPHGGNEFHKLVTFRKSIANERIGVRADTELHGFARNAQGLASTIFIQLNGTITAGGTLPF